MNTKQYESMIFYMKLNRDRFKLVARANNKITLQLGYKCITHLVEGYYSQQLVMKGKWQ